MQVVNALAEIASSLPDFIGGASRNDDWGPNVITIFSGVSPGWTLNDDGNKFFLHGHPNLHMPHL
jgi:hypothetical protein